MVIFRERRRTLNALPFQTGFAPLQNASPHDRKKRPEVYLLVVVYWKGGGRCFQNHWPEEDCEIGFWHDGTSLRHFTEASSCVFLLARRGTYFFYNQWTTQLKLWLENISSHLPADSLHLSPHLPLSNNQSWLGKLIGCNITLVRPLVY